jgi:predicted GNAT family N-acyltransferase
MIIADLGVSTILTHANELASSTMHSTYPLRMNSFVVAVSCDNTDELFRQNTGA